MKKVVLCIVLPLLILVVACESEPDTTIDIEPASQKKSWDEFRDQFIESYFDYNPSEAVLAGRHEYDG